MTGIKDILKQFGVTVPEDKAKDFDKLFQENYKSVNEVSKIELARDNYKEQLQTAQNSLKEFEGDSESHAAFQITYSWQESGYIGTVM